MAVKKKLMEDDGYFIKTLFRRQSALNVLALLVSTIGPIVCTILAGRHFGSEGLAIIAICAPLFFAASFFGSTISSGAQIVCSEFIAKDEPDNVNRTYSAAIILTLVLGVFVCSTLFVFRRPLLTFMAGSISTSLFAYYNFFVLSAFVTMLVYIPLFFSRAVGRAEIGLVLTGVMAGVSIALSLVLVRFMGIEAIALGQAVGALVGLIVSMLMLRKHFKFRLTKNLRVKQILAYGSPEGLPRLYALITTATLNGLFLRIGGSDALATFGVISTLNRFNSAIIAGISQTPVPLISIFHEEQDITSIKQTIKLAFCYGNALILITGVIFTAFCAVIADIFGLAQNELLVAAMPYYAVYALLLLNASTLSSYYNAVKKIGLANIIPFLQEFALLCSGALVLSAAFGIYGIWLAFPLSGLVALFILLCLIAAIKLRQKELTFPLLQNYRLEKEGRYISFSVEGTPEKASEAAAKISDFCEENNLSPKQVMLISMSVEEIITLITNNIKLENFSASVRLFLLEGSVVLRIRNTGEKFDAIEYYKANIADDIEKSLEVIGMKYIVNSANVIYYRQTFGVNNLVVIL